MPKIDKNINYKRFGSLLYLLRQILGKEIINHIVDKIDWETEYWPKYWSYTDEQENTKNRTTKKSKKSN